MVMAKTTRRATKKKKTTTRKTPRRKKAVRKARKKPVKKRKKNEPSAETASDGASTTVDAYVDEDAARKFFELWQVQREKNNCFDDGFEAGKLDAVEEMAAKAEQMEAQGRQYIIQVYPSTAHFILPLVRRRLRELRDRITEPPIEARVDAECPIDD